MDRRIIKRIWDDKMSLQRKIATTALITLLLSIGFAGAVEAFSNNDVQPKTFASEECGFSISYPKSWENEVYLEGDKPQVYRSNSLILHATEDPAASVTVLVTEVTEAPTLGDLKRYYELRAKLFPDVGITDI